MSGIAKELDLKSLKWMQVSRVDLNIRRERKTRCSNLEGRYAPAEVKKVVFTDEKDLHVKS